MLTRHQINFKHKSQGRFWFLRPAFINFYKFVLFYLVYITFHTFQLAKYNKYARKSLELHQKQTLKKPGIAKTKRSSIRIRDKADANQLATSSSYNLRSKADLTKRLAK
jgi:hypothetical protein